jgi:polysaccharide biosynthesis protein PelE
MLLGLTTEALAGFMLWSSAGIWSVAAAIALHGVASYSFARAFWLLLPRQYKLPARRSLSLLFTILFILPGVGALGLAWGVIGALKRPRSRSAENVRVIILPELPFSPPAIFPVPPYSEGALRQIVYFAARPLKRLKAVMATRQMPARKAMAVWSRAVRDPVDDIRLLAYGMKDANEKKLASQIQELKEALADAPARVRKSHHQMIAALCWELVYHRFAEGAVRLHWLQDARYHMEQAIVSPTASTSSPVRPVPGSPEGDGWFLYGRILMALGDFTLAREALNSAKAAGMDAQKILPWFAEIAFNERKFPETKQWMVAWKGPGEKGSELAQVKEWWDR